MHLERIARELDELTHAMAAMRDLPRQDQLRILSRLVELKQALGDDELASSLAFGIRQAQQGKYEGAQHTLDTIVNIIAERLHQPKTPPKAPLWKRWLRGLGLPVALAATLTAASQPPAGSTPETAVDLAPLVVTPPRPLLALQPDFTATLQRLPKHVSTIRKLAREASVSDSLIVGMIAAESKGDEHARSGAGALGLMQIMPATGKDLGASPRQLLDGETNITLGTTYFARLLRRYEGYDAQVELALAAYNWGPGNVSNLLARLEPDQAARKHLRWDQVAVRLPKETRNHVPKVLGFAQQWEQVKHTFPG